MTIHDFFSWHQEKARMSEKSESSPILRMGKTRKKTESVLTVKDRKKRHIEKLGIVEYKKRVANRMAKYRSKNSSIKNQNFNRHKYDGLSADEKLKKKRELKRLSVRKYRVNQLVKDSPPQLQIVDTPKSARSECEQKSLVVPLSISVVKPEMTSDCDCDIEPSSPGMHQTLYGDCTRDEYFVYLSQAEKKFPNLVEQYKKQWDDTYK